MIFHAAHRRALTFTTSLVALATAAGAAPVMAQTASPGDAPSNIPQSSVEPESARTPNQTGGSDIVVTGSRIRRPDYETASPIVSLSAVTIQQSGTTNLTDFLTGYPALIGSSTSNQNSGDRAGIGQTGINLLNLRNFGTQRTLVLVDGRRHVSGVEGSEDVDINTIPQDLIDRVDVLTGGASAIYGADAVTGVVNFVLKKNFEGITARAQAGISEHGDAGQKLFTITAGKNFADGRGNIAIAYEYGLNDRYTTQDRDYLTGANSVSFRRNPNYVTNTPGSYYVIPTRDARYVDTARNGAVDVTFDGIPEFTGTGKVYDRGSILPGNAYAVGGDSTSLADYGNDLLPRVERHVANLVTHFDVSPALTIFAEGKYAQTNSYSLAQPTFDYYLFVPQDNPYIPGSIRAAIDPANGGVLVTRDNFDLGQRGENIRRETYRGVIGARGDLADDLHYEVSYVYGQTDVTAHYVNDRYTDRFLDSIDVVTGANGQPQCRVTALGTAAAIATGASVTPVSFEANQCVPLNIFGEGVASQAALNFIHASTTDRSRITQQVLSGSVGGDFRRLFSLPGGELSYSVGGEYRRETSSFTPDAIAQQGLTFTNALSPTSGKFNVKEAFAELDAPLLKDRPFFQLLDVAAAIRYSDYSTIGSTTTYKADLTWAPVRDVRFRGTYSYAVRAPNIGELFGGASQTFAFFDDPCTVNNRTLGTSSRASNCVSVLSAAGLSAAQIAAYEDPRSVNIAGTQSGNSALKAERARTWTAGVVLSPRFVPGFTASFDWYDIKLKDAINTVDPQQLAELCVDQPSIQNQFCSTIGRETGTGLITSFSVQPQNVANFQTAGLDVNLNYRLNTSKFGVFNLKVVGNYLNKLSFTGTPGAVATDDLRSTNEPKFQVNSDLTWVKGIFTLNYGLSWYDKTYRPGITPLILAGNANYIDPQYAFLKDRWVHDIYASVDVTKNFQFYGGVNNVADQKPDLGQASYPVESVGRFFFAGARVKLPKF
jgi:iron complex outermembrane receptor protein